MRTTVRLPGDLLEMAKRKAASQGRTLTDLIADAVRAELAAEPPTKRVKLPVFHGDGLLPGVDVNNMAQVLGIMDEREPR